MSATSYCEGGAVTQDLSPQFVQILWVLSFGSGPTRFGHIVVLRRKEFFLAHWAFSSLFLLLSSGTRDGQYLMQTYTLIGKWRWCTASRGPGNLCVAGVLKSIIWKFGSVGLVKLPDGFSCVLYKQSVWCDNLRH
jgi:hypothetical protein